jgi:hypothetical protein
MEFATFDLKRSQDVQTEPFVKELSGPKGVGDAARLFLARHAILLIQDDDLRLVRFCFCGIVQAKAHHR